LPNCPEFALLWLALLRIGAVEAPVNTAFRGAGLGHVLDLSECRLLVIDDAYLPCLDEVRSGLSRLERVVTPGGLGGRRGVATHFWDQVREFEATHFDFMGSTLTMLWKQPARPDDADNPARVGWGVPMPDFAAGFEERFAVRLVEGYGMTDCGLPVSQPFDEP